MTKPKPDSGNAALKGADLGVPPVLPPTAISPLRQLAVATDRIAASLATIAQAVTVAMAEDQASGRAAGEQRERRERAEDARAARVRIHWDTVTQAESSGKLVFAWEATGDPLTDAERVALDLARLEPVAWRVEALTAHMARLRHMHPDPYGRG
jgi:hypothetical protein